MDSLVVLKHHFIQHAPEQAQAKISSQILSNPKRAIGWLAAILAIIGTLVLSVTLLENRSVDRSETSGTADFHEDSARLDSPGRLPPEYGLLTEEPTLPKDAAIDHPELRNANMRLSQSLLVEKSQQPLPAGYNLPEDLDL
jgi:hypothetical protein